jgi:hypothetical protein
VIRYRRMTNQNHLALDIPQAGRFAAMLTRPKKLLIGLQGAMGPRGRALQPVGA